MDATGTGEVRAAPSCTLNFLLPARRKQAALPLRPLAVAPLTAGSRGLADGWTQQGQRQQSAAAAQAAAVARATAAERQRREQQAALRHARPDAAPHGGIRNRPWKSRRGLGEDPAFDVQDDYVYTRCVRRFQPYAVHKP
jgi:hypothetical protein